MVRSSGNAAPEIEVTVSNRTIFRVIAAVVLAFLAVVAVRRSVHALALIGAALFLALALNGPVHWLADHLPGRVRGSRGFATGVSIVIVLLLLSAFLWAIVPPLVDQTTKFIQQAPDLIGQVRDQNSGVGKFIREHNLESPNSRSSFLIVPIILVARLFLRLPGLAVACSQC
jgi:predicted PurR-regulated permease PerM